MAATGASSPATSTPGASRSASSGSLGRPAPRRCRLAVGYPRPIGHRAIGLVRRTSRRGGRSRGDPDLLAGADRLVDGLLGTGLSRPVEGPLRTVIEAINDSGKPVFAPGPPLGPRYRHRPTAGRRRPAEATATFVAPKLGFPPPARPITPARSPSSTSGCRDAWSSRISCPRSVVRSPLFADATRHGHRATRRRTEHN